MKRMRFTEAIDHALAEAMARDERILVFGEDLPLLRSSLFVRFGPDRVLATPISESGFLGAGVGAALAGLRPVVELMMIDFLAVGLDALLNQAAMIETFSGGSWPCPLLLRAPCGGGYGDGGQHGQSLWGMLAAIPGLSVVVPSTPADGAGLMASALALDSPVVFLEPKLLSDLWLGNLGSSGRETVSFDRPEDGIEGEVELPIESVELGRAALRRRGSDVTLASLGVGVHRCLAAATELAAQGLEAEVLDLRSVRPLDRDTVLESVAKTGGLVVADEDYRDFGLSGELAATVLEAGLAPRFGRVCVEGTLPYARHLEEAALPNAARIVQTVLALVKPDGDSGPHLPS